MKLFLLFTFNANSTSAAWMSDRTRRVWTNKLWCSELWVFSCFNQHFNVSNSCSISSSTAVSCRIQPKKGRTLTFIFSFRYKNLYRKQIFFLFIFLRLSQLTANEWTEFFHLNRVKMFGKTFPTSPVNVVGNSIYSALDLFLPYTTHSSICFHQRQLGVDMCRIDRWAQQSIHKKIN